MKHILTFSEPIRSWDEAIPLGCGQNGTLIWGTPEHLRFSLDRTDLWDLSTPLNSDRPDFTYAHLVELARAGKTDEIRELFDAPYNYPTPTKLPAGKLIFSFPAGGTVASELSLEEAEASLEIGLPEQTVRLQALCHAVSKTGMIRVEAPAHSFTVTLVHPDFGLTGEAEALDYDPEHREISQGSLQRLHYPAPQQGREEGSPSFTWFTQEVVGGFTYGIVLGTLALEKETLLFYRIAASNDGKNWLENAKAQLHRELQQGYDRCRSSHRLWWQRFWERSSVSLPDAAFETQWYTTNYLFASCSRKGQYPMPLQGVWTADDGMLPPWKGDYHNDLNTQLSYTHCYRANHLEEAESFLDYLWNMRGAARRFAKGFYGTEGICLPGTMTLDGQPLGGWPMYSLSPVNQIWLAQSFDLYYRHTGDRKFLEQRAYPYFAETAQCITALLEEKDGLFYLPVSSSPEIHDDEQASWVTPNSNYDLSLLRYLYGTLAEQSRLLNNGQAEKWQSILDKLPALAVNEHHVLMISPDESLQESHRHHSTAMAICPLKLLDNRSPEDRQIIDATVLDLERLGTGMWVGFSFAWMAHFYAIQHNGEGAFYQLRTFWENTCAPNGFHLNGDFRKRGTSTFHYRPFTLESNMYAADGLQEMLLQSRGDRIDLFPAIPAHWNRGIVSFTCFRAEGGVLVSATLEQGRLRSLRLQSQEPHICTLYHTSLAGGCLNVTLQAGADKTIHFHHEKIKLSGEKK